MPTQINLDEVEFLTGTSITLRRARGRTTVPKEIVDHFGLNDGGRLLWILFKDGRLILVPKKVSGKNSDGSNSVV